MGLKDKDRVCKINKSTGIGRRKRGGSRGLWFLAPSLLGVGYLVLLPTGDVLRRSFTTALSGQWVGLENYGNVLTNSAFRLATGNTLVFLGICLPLLLALSLLLALVVCRIPRLERFKVLYLLPMAVPAATVVLVWRLLFSKQGFLNGSAYTITVLSMLNAFKSFREAYLVSGAYPQQDIYLLQHLFQNWYTKLDMDKLAAGAILLALALGTLSLLLQRLWDRAGD